MQSCLSGKKNSRTSSNMYYFEIAFIPPSHNYKKFRNRHVLGAAAIFFNKAYLYVTLKDYS